MKKKQYIKPAMQAYDIQQGQILCSSPGSDTRMWEQIGGGGIQF